MQPAFHHHAGGDPEHHPARPRYATPLPDFPAPQTLPGQKVLREQVRVQIVTRPDGRVTHRHVHLPRSRYGGFLSNREES